MSQEIPELSEENWATVVKNAQTTCEKLGIPWTGGDADICGAYTILVETGEVESHEAMRVVYELGRRSQGDLLAAAKRIFNRRPIGGLTSDVLLEDGDLDALEEAIHKAEGRA